MTDILDKIPSMTDADLRKVRENAQHKLATASDEHDHERADKVLRAVEAEFDERRIPGMIERFKEVFPGGFDDEQHHHDERDYKVAAHNRCLELLGRDTFADCLERDDFDTLLERVREIVSATNLIQGSIEKPQLLDTIAEPQNRQPFFRALFDCLHGPGEPADRLERFARSLDELGLAKWTYASYFLFLNEPERCMFVKPQGLQKAVERAEYALTYDSRPTGRLYEQILQFSEWLRGRLERNDLQPRDMIDVQSFIWYMAPTGKHAA